MRLVVTNVPHIATASASCPPTYCGFLMINTRNPCSRFFSGLPENTQLEGVQVVADFAEYICHHVGPLPVNVSDNVSPKKAEMQRVIM